MEGIAKILLTGAGIPNAAQSISAFLNLPYKAVFIATTLASHSGYAGGLPRNQTGAHSPVQEETPNDWLRNSRVLFRAAYIEAASRRISTVLANGGDVPKAMQNERRYFDLHKSANASRRLAIRAVEQQRGIHGEVLGWYAHEDDRTTPDCRAADGNNFRADVPPVIGYPGTVHSRCRCRPGAPHLRGRMVDDAVKGVHDDAMHS